MVSESASANVPRRPLLTAAEIGGDSVENRTGRFLGCVVGALAGDALGRRVESLSLSEIRSRFGAAGVTEPGAVDPEQRMSDGAVLLALSLDGMIRADSFLLRGGEPLAELRSSFEYWSFGQDPVIGGATAEWLSGHLRGSQVVESLRARLRGESAELPELLHGSIPTVLWSTRSEEVVDYARWTAGILGETGENVAAAQAVAVIVQQSVLTGKLDRGLESLSSGEAEHLGAGRGMDTEHRAGRDEVMRALVLAKAMAGAGTTPEEIESLGDGYTAKSALAIALCAVRSAAGFDDAVRIAANHSGNSPLTAALAGAMWGAVAGLDSTLERWFVGVPDSRRLHGLVQDVAAQFTDDAGADVDRRRRYPLTGSAVEPADIDRSPGREIEVSAAEKRVLAKWRDFWWNRHELPSGGGGTFLRLADDVLGEQALVRWRAREASYRNAHPARTGRAPAGPSPHERWKKRVSRALPGLVYGAACGDAVGLAEQDGTAFGRSSSFAQLLMFALEGCTSAHLDAVRSRSRSDFDRIRRATWLAYANWRHAQGVSWADVMGDETCPAPRGWLVHEQAMQFRAHPDATVCEALQEVRTGARDFTAAANNASRSCGPLASGLVQAVWADDADHLRRIAVATTSLTHGSKEVECTAVAVVFLCFALIKEVPVADAVHRVNRVMADLGGAESTVRALETALNLTGTDELAEAFGETSNAQAALGVAVNSVLRHPVDFERAVGAAASVAGDRPATAAICGALIGASNGVGGIPTRRVNALAVRGVADRLIKDAATQFGEPAPPSSGEWFERYDHLMGAEGEQW